MAVENEVPPDSMPTGRHIEGYQQEASANRRTMKPEGIFLFFFPHDGMGAHQELQITITDIYEGCPADMKVDRFDREYSVRFYADGFTEIARTGESPNSGRAKAYRGETLESAFRKAIADGMLESTRNNIIASIEKNIEKYRQWISDIENEAGGLLPR